MLFDCEVIAAPSLALEASVGEVLGARRPDVGVYRLSVKIEEGRRVTRAVRTAQGNAIVVPVTYRNAPVTLADARERADRFRLSKMQAGRRLEPLEAEGVLACAFDFASTDPDAVAQGMVPGRLFIRVDRLDGHIWLDEEYWDFADLQGWDGP
jgi:hypothetical protein